MEWLLLLASAIPALELHLNMPSTNELHREMTLTGRLNETRRQPVRNMLHERFSATGIEKIEIDRIVLFRQDDADARFRIIGDWPLCAA